MVKNGDGFFTGTFYKNSVNDNNGNTPQSRTYNSREYREVSKLSSGQFAIISGAFLKLNEFMPNQKETYYASRPLTSDDLKTIQNTKYGNGDELFLSYITYIAAAN